ncbi:leukocyte receptor cluster member 8-like isoform X2 [Sycon ciliatum]|uniref:leukocyte receptor cluster member 8-like isoform X2 n=1 Tax=Sycon ciliatum TaxID=27933 RepID=UPI0031F6F583
MWYSNQQQQATATTPTTASSTAASATASTTTTLAATVTITPYPYSYAQAATGYVAPAPYGQYAATMGYGTHQQAQAQQSTYGVPPPPGTETAAASMPASNYAMMYGSQVQPVPQQQQSQLHQTGIAAWGGQQQQPWGGWTSASYYGAAQPQQQQQLLQQQQQQQQQHSQAQMTSQGQPQATQQARPQKQSRTQHSLLKPRGPHTIGQQGSALPSQTQLSPPPPPPKPAVLPTPVTSSSVASQSGVTGAECTQETRTVNAPAAGSNPAAISYAAALGQSNQSGLASNRQQKKRKGGFAPLKARNRWDTPSNRVENRPGGGQLDGVENPAALSSTATQSSTGQSSASSGPPATALGAAGSSQTAGSYAHASSNGARPGAQPNAQPSAQPSAQPNAQPSAQPGGQPAHIPSADDANDTTKWPPAMKEYVQDIFQSCKTDEEKDKCESYLRDMLQKSFRDGWAWTTDWKAKPRFSSEDVPSRTQPTTGSTHVSRWQTASGTGGVTGATSTGKRGRGRGRGRNVFRGQSDSYRRRRSRSSSSSRSSRSSSYSDSDDSESSGAGRSTTFARGRGKDIKSRLTQVAAGKKKKKKQKNLTFSHEMDAGKLKVRQNRFVQQRSMPQFERTSIMDHIFRMNNDTGEDRESASAKFTGTCKDLEKPYLRLTSAPLPNQVRPESVLHKSLELVKQRWKAQACKYLTVCEQLKSIRQDLTIQCIRNPFAIEVYETHARIALENRDPEEFNQCQTQLKELYFETNEGHQAEFAAYRIYYNMFTKSYQGLAHELQGLSDSLLCEPCVMHALAVRAAWSEANYARFFHLYGTTFHMGSYLLDLLLPRERLAAVRAMAKTYRPSLPVEFVQSQLGFTTVEQCVAFLSLHQASFADAACTVLDGKLTAGSLSASVVAPPAEKES